MGSDIHVVVEVKDSNNTWQLQSESSNKYNKNLWSVERNYPLFAILGDVRNGERLVPLFADRGLPKDIAKDTDVEYCTWVGDAHSASYAALTELISAKLQCVSMQFFLSKESYLHFKKSIKIDYGFLDAADVLSPYSFYKIVSNVEMDRLISLAAFDDCKEEYITSVIVPYSGYYKHNTYCDISPVFFNDFLNKISSFDSNPENIRIVFWFDN